ncbi:MAG: DUF4440 domain-containing protein [Gemmatimonadota bacterium]|nr:DUF4440 domain-containing protein [Gemmatimonadota bacterium]MDH5551424.1 DUF4440 domain-containing protein [Gemmatimonadota bacterium]
MRFRCFVFFLLPIATGLTGCPAGSGPLTDEDRAAIRETAAAFHDAAAAKDWSAVVQFYTPDAVVMPPNQAALQGRAAIREWYASFPPVTDVDLPIVDVDGRADLAYTRGTYTLTFAMEGAPQPITDRGKNLAIWRKQPDGSWQMAIDTFNSDLPLP